jgi:DNA-binding beta-propeller fold protein YncE
VAVSPEMVLAHRILARSALGLLLAAALAWAPSAEAQPAYGALSQLPGRDGCTGLLFDSCRPGTLGGQRLVLSPDERFAYVASENGTVAGYLRNRRTGALRSLRGAGACVVGSATKADLPAAAMCTAWDLLGPTPDAGVAVSPDGRHLYLASGGVTFLPPDPSERPTALVTLERDERTGRLRPAGCVAPQADGCMPTRGMDGWVAGLAVSPDGRSIYVVSSVQLGSQSGSSIAVFVRDPASGALTQPPGPDGCIAPAAYAGCRPARGLAGGGASVAVSPDGRHLYVGGEDTHVDPPDGGTIVAFARDPETGSLTQLPGQAGCLTIDGREGCGRARTLGSWLPDLPDLVISPDGHNVYAPFVTRHELSGGVASFSRDRTTGALAQLRGGAGCTSERRVRECRRGRALGYPTGAAISGDGRNVYVSASNSAAVSVFERGPGGALEQLPGRAACVGGYPGPPIPGPPGAGPVGGEKCTPAATVRQDPTLTRDGRYAYVPGDQEIIVFARNAPRARVKVSRRGCAQAGLRVSVSVWTEGRLRRATVRLDGRVVHDTTRRRFGFTIARSRLAARRRHSLRVLATDASGRRSLHAVRVVRCPSR